MRDVFRPLVIALAAIAACFAAGASAAEPGPTEAELKTAIERFYNEVKDNKFELSEKDAVSWQGGLMRFTHDGQPKVVSRVRLVACHAGGDAGAYQCRFAFTVTNTRELSISAGGEGRFTRDDKGWVWSEPLLNYRPRQ